MTKNPDDSLTLEELASLGEFAQGPLRSIDPPPDHRKKLSDLGYIAKRSGEEFITPEGERRWFQRQSRRPTS
jgi:hypothetical protein